MRNGNRVESQYLYMLKGIACYLVVFVHFGISYTGGFYELTRIAVPIFFIIQGRFLTVQSNEITLNAARKKNISSLYKLIKTTILVTLIYILFSFLFWVVCDGETLENWYVMKFAPIEWLKLLVFNSSKVIYDWNLIFDHQWYLYAAISAIFIIILFQRFINKYTIVLFMFSLILLFLNQYIFKIGTQGLIINEHMIDKMFLTRNFLFTALPFIAYGIVLQYLSKVSISKLLQKNISIILVVCMFIGGLLTYVEYFKFGTQELYIGSALLAISVTTLGQFIEREPLKIFSWIGKNLSKDIFYWHPLVAVLATRIIPVSITAKIQPFYIAILSTVVALVLLGMRSIYEKKRIIIN